MSKKIALAGLLVSFSFAVAPWSAYSAELQATQAAPGTPPVSRKVLDRGKYMLVVGSCNDCHTAGFAASNGNVPEKDWLLGSGPLGFRGPWGTTYASNLRLVLSKMTESEWVKHAKGLKTLPPMPWFNLNQWTDSDLRAFYQYVKSLGPVGQPAPAYLPPDKAPKPPFIQWPAPPK